MGQTWTVTTSSSIMDERDSDSIKFYLKEGDYVDRRTWTSGNNRGSTLTPADWCLYFDKFRPQFKDRSVVSSLNAEFGATYPNIEYDRWDSS